MNGADRPAVPSLGAWRERVVRVLARSAAILVVVAYPPSIWLSIVNGFPSLVVIDTLACGGLLLAALRPSLPYRVRAGVLLGVFYVLAVVLLVQVGMPGAGLVWLSMVPVVAALLLGMRAAIVALSVMGGTVALFGIGIAAGLLRWTAGPGHVADGQDLTVWFVNATNSFLLSSGAALSAATILRGLEVAIHDVDQAAGERERAARERSQLEEQLRQAQKLEAVGRLAGGIAHDFNNLLTPIVAYTEEARHELPPDSKAAQQLTEVLRSAQRAGHLVRRILTFSRHSVVTRAPVRVADVVREAGALLRATLPTSIAIRYEISAEDATVVADAAELQQVLMNLGTNALDAMQGQGGMLAFGVRQSGTCVEITVRDTGCGMDAHALEHAFEPFFTTKPQGKGTGLGLATSHTIVQALGGQVWLASEPGAGTTVTLSLPLVKPVDGSPAPGASSSLTRGNGERILLVDDEPMVLGACEALLKRMGYRVTAVSDPAAALAHLRSAPYEFDLLFTDQSMPGMNGVELARASRTVRSDLPVVLTTGFVDEATRAGLTDAGIDTVLAKPYQPADLGATVQAALQPVVRNQRA
jgi:signal transduction histidine kinase/ActR/RegA family two-component response regulator